MLGWLLLFQPGMVSPDSLNVWRQARGVPWTDAHPPLYTALMWLSAQTTSSPALLAAGQGLLLAAGIVSCARALVRFGVPKVAVAVPAVALAWSPMVGAFSISLWKDVPYAGVFLFASARTVDLVDARLHSRTSPNALRSLVAWLCVLALLRQNGIVVAVALLLGLLCILPAQRVRLMVGVACVIATLVTAKFVVYPTFRVRPAVSNANFANVLHDVAAQLSDDPHVLEPDERAALERIAPIPEWVRAYRSSGCWSQNWQFDPAFRWSRLGTVRSDLMGTWLRLTTTHPMVELRNRACVSAIAWSPFPVGPTYTVERSVAPNDDGLRLGSVDDDATAAAVDVLDQLDRPELQILFWRAPGWMLVAAASVATAALRDRRWLVFAVLLPLAAFTLSVAPFNPSQDARYMFPALIYAVMLVPTGWRTTGPQRQGVLK